MLNTSGTNFRWYVLVLAASIMAIVMGMSEMCMAVLFAEISDDLNLNLVQVGTIWGIVPLGSVTFILIGGAICDRFGAKRTIGIACILVGITGAMRGLSEGYVSLLTVSFFFGLLGAMIPVSVIKSNSIWFPSQRLGFANGVTATGFGVGAAVSSLISATYLSPLVGGWRNLLFVYGAISILVGLIWLLTTKEPKETRTVKSETTVQFRQILSGVFRIKAVWLIGLTLFAYMGGSQAIVGYLPLYLRESGWQAIHADGSLTVFNITGTIAVIPLAMLSDRLGRRKAVLVPAALITITCAGLLSVVSNVFVWGIVVMLGFFHAAHRSLTVTMCLETEGVGAKYSGMAVGLVYTLGRIGIFIAPPVGNSLASISPGMPFVLWAAMFFIGAIILIFFIRETGWEVRGRHISPDIL